MVTAGDRWATGGLVSIYRSTLLFLFLSFSFSRSKSQILLYVYLSIYRNFSFSLSFPSLTLFSIYPNFSLTLSLFPSLDQSLKFSNISIYLSKFLFLLSFFNTLFFYLSKLLFLSFSFSFTRSKSQLSLLYPSISFYISLFPSLIQSLKLSYI